MKRFGKILLHVSLAALCYLSLGASIMLTPAVAADVVAAKKSEWVYFDPYQSYPLTCSYSEDDAVQAKLRSLVLGPPAASSQYSACLGAQTEIT
jgi:hypothetical protein